MPTDKIWRYMLIGTFVLYVIALIRIVGVALDTPSAGVAAETAMDVFAATFAVPVGVATAVLLLVVRRRPAAERAAYRHDERKRGLWRRSVEMAFWVLLVGNVVALSVPDSDGTKLAIVVGATVLAFGVVFFVAAVDEFRMMDLEAEAD